jgi:hypothetical protein
MMCLPPVVARAPSAPPAPEALRALHGTGYPNGMLGDQQNHRLGLAFVSAAMLSLTMSCGGPRPGRMDGGPSGDAAVIANPDATTGDSGGTGLVTGAPANIREALNCEAPQPITGMTRATYLQLHAVDTGVFPDALCNDGTGAILYFRPYRGEANRDRWVISLRGGGACNNAGACAARWCSCETMQLCPHATETTNFSLNNMSGGGLRSLDGNGVQSREHGMENPLADYNHVQLVYCSSDAWRGTVRGVTYTATHPRTGAPVTYTVHFLGARILDADLRTLRQDGVPALVYTADGGRVAMPDLDEASEVVFVGDSAGGNGLIQNLDYLADTLRANRTGCAGGANCPPRVSGIIDAVVGPDMARLDFTDSIGAPFGVTSYDGYTASLAANPQTATGRRDESCVRWHRAMEPGTESRCLDHNHVIRHHVMTPFVLRMALYDALISKTYENLGLADPMRGPFVRDAMGVPTTFANALRPEMQALPDLAMSAEERMSVRVAPGVFAPGCFNHDTIHEDTEVFQATITPTGGRITRFFDVFTPWYAGMTPAAAVSVDPMRRDSFCPPAR